jgi:CRP/FNR family transcriptional regulator
MEYDELLRGIKPQSHNEAVGLLAESLYKKSNQHGIRALRAIGLLGDRETMNLTIDILEMRNSAQRANVIEALESIHARWRKIIQPLTRLWEEAYEGTSEPEPNWQRLINDEDPWIRDCALFAAHKLGESTMENIQTLSLMERILFLKRVPLFQNLSPTDLKQVAALAQEDSFSDGVTIAIEGEVGDIMYIIVSGEVSVTSTRDGKDVELARRKTGEYVGEMALISKEPRIATLTTVGNVRALCIDQKSFESLLRDRPDVSLAVIQILCDRLKEASTRLHHSAARL